jgi:hypothetical protein
MKPFTDKEKEIINQGLVIMWQKTQKYIDILSEKREMLGGRRLSSIIKFQEKIEALIKKVQRYKETI